MSSVRTPIRSRRSSIWSSACTAVVGSLIAGDNALIATSARSRNANFGSCSIVRSVPSRNDRRMSCERDRAAEHPGDDVSARDRVAHADLDHDRRLGHGRQLHEPFEVDRSQNERRALVDVAPGFHGRAVEIAALGWCRLIAGQPVERLDHVASSIADQGEHVGEVHLAQCAVEQEEEQEHAREQEQERECDGRAEVVILVASNRGESDEGVHERGAEGPERVTGERRLAEPLHQPQRIRGAPELRHDQADREDDAGESDHARRRSRRATALRQALRENGGPGSRGRLAEGALLRRWRAAHTCRARPSRALVTSA